MGMSVGGSGGVKSEPNVVPMIDIMLVLLIIFMLVLPTLMSGFTATPPQGVNLTPKEEEDEDIVLGIDVNGQYYIDKLPIKNEELADHISRRYAVREIDKILFIRADKGLEYGKVLDVIDIVSRNGVRVAAMIMDQTPNTVSSVSTDPGGGN